MSVSIFIQEHNGDFNGEFEAESLEDAQGIVDWINQGGGYWFNQSISKEFLPVAPEITPFRYPFRHQPLYQSHIRYFWENLSAKCSIFIPLHRIDRIEIRGE
jgi:hypothetical protein